MKTRSLLASAAALAAATALVLQPAGASTVAQLSVTADGTLSIAEPTGTASSPVKLGSLASGVTAGTAPNALGAVKVTDTRTTGITSNNWVATATGTAFTKVGVASPDTLTETIPAASITYTPGTVTTTVVTGQTAAATTVAGLLTTGATVTMVATGTNTASWNPTLTFTIPSTVKAGDYQGTVTHSAL